MSKTPHKQDEEKAPHFDDVLKRMLGTPPKQHKDEKHPKPAKQHGPEPSKKGEI